MSASGSTQRLLVVADATLRSHLRAALSFAEREVVDADSVAAARELAAGSRFHLALVDLDVAGAAALCEEFAANEAMPPILALARADDPALVALEASCRDVVEKPASSATLRIRVARALETLGVERELRESRNRLQRTQRFARLGHLEIDWTARHARLSEEARRILGMADDDAELPLDRLADVVAGDQRERWRTWLADVAGGATERPFEHGIVRPDRSERVVRLQVERAVDPLDGSIRLHAVVHDVTDRFRVEEELQYQNHHDELTGLANRRQLLEGLERAIEQSRRDGRVLAVLFLDLDRFQDVNETFGHDGGDRLLVAVSQRLRESVREQDAMARVASGRTPDSVARPGGDEFVIALAGLRDRRNAGAVAERVLDALARPFTFEGREISLTACAGIATSPDDAKDGLALLQNAETALFQAKRRGCASYAFYDPSLDRLAHERLEGQSALRRAIERRELEVWYQPRVEIAGERIVGMEALVRWRDPDRGIVLPAQFIPLAEQSGLIVQLGGFVLREACMQARQWRDAGFTDLRVAVNLSAEQFRDPALPGFIERVTSEAGLRPDGLELELTESALMRDVERALELLERLKRKGFHLSIDDFGTGYSSLAYLKRLPIDCLKIDASFVRDVTTDAGNGAIAAAILSMAHSLDLDVVAEGVETREQLEFLRRHGCEQVQGYLFSAPVPAAAATALLQKQVVEPMAPAPPPMAPARS